MICIAGRELSDIINQESYVKHDHCRIFLKPASKGWSAVVFLAELESTQLLLVGIAGVACLAKTRVWRGCGGTDRHVTVRLELNIQITLGMFSSGWQYFSYFEQEMYS